MSDKQPLVVLARADTKGASGYTQRVRESIPIEGR